MPPCGRGGGGGSGTRQCARARRRSGRQKPLGPPIHLHLQPQPQNKPHTCVPMRSWPALTVPSGAFIENKATLLLVTAAGVLVNTTSPGGKESTQNSTDLGAPVLPEQGQQQGRMKECSKHERDGEGGKRQMFEREGPRLQLERGLPGLNSELNRDNH